MVVYTNKSQGKNMADLLGGVMLNRFWGNQAAAQADTDASGWRAKASNLENLLKRSEENLLFRRAEFDANDYVLKLALEALQAANPNSPLLDKGNRDLLRRRHIASALATQGYQFDVATGKVNSKVR